MGWLVVERQPYWSPRRPSVGIDRPKILYKCQPAHDMEGVWPLKIIRGESNSITGECNCRRHSASTQLSFNSITQQFVLGVKCFTVDMVWLSQYDGWCVGKGRALLKKACCQWPIFCASFALAGESIPGK